MGLESQMTKERGCKRRSDVVKFKPSVVTGDVGQNPWVSGV